MSYDIESKCKMHLLDPNFSKIYFLLPPEISTTSVLNDEISLKNVHFPWKSSDFGMLLVEISGLLPMEISPIIKYKFQVFLEKKIRPFRSKHQILTTQIKICGNTRFLAYFYVETNSKASKSLGNTMCSFYTQKEWRNSFYTNAI